MKLLQILLLFICLTPSIPASPLVFKTSMEIDAVDKGAEFFTLDTTKYKSLRIFVFGMSANYSIIVQAVDGTDINTLVRRERVQFEDTFVLETPPDKIRVRIAGKGTFRACVWAS
jgi:hypothetical protein